MKVIMGGKKNEVVKFGNEEIVLEIVFGNVHV